MQNQEKLKAVELTADMIGSPSDDFKKPERETSIRKEQLFRAGYIAGFNSAADDYVNNKVKASLNCFEEEIRSARDLTDFYSVGFEVGYLRKSLEILKG